MILSTQLGIIAMGIIFAVGGILYAMNYDFTELSYKIQFAAWYPVYFVDLVTHDKPCGYVGNYCSYYTETEHCYVSDHYTICDVIGDGIGYD